MWIKDAWWASSAAGGDVLGLSCGFLFNSGRGFTLLVFEKESCCPHSLPTIHTSCCSKHPHHRVFRWYLLLIIVCLSTCMCVCISKRGGERGRMEGGRDEERELCDVSVPPSGLIFSFQWVPRVALTSSGYIASIFTHWAAHSAITRMLAQSCTVQPPLLWIYSYIDCAFCLLTFC